MKFWFICYFCCNKYNLDNPFLRGKALECKNKTKQTKKHLCSWPNVALWHHTFHTWRSCNEWRGFRPDYEITGKPFWVKNSLVWDTSLLWASVSSPGNWRLSLPGLWGSFRIKRADAHVRKWSQCLASSEHAASESPQLWIRPTVVFCSHWRQSLNLKDTRVFYFKEKLPIRPHTG